MTFQFVMRQMFYLRLAQLALMLAFALEFQLASKFLMLLIEILPNAAFGHHVQVQ